MKAHESRLSEDGQRPGIDARLAITTTVHREWSAPPAIRQGEESTLPHGLGGLRDTPSVRWRPGVRVGRYELVERIGAGGMGVVWSARDIALGRDVAVKLIRSRERSSSLTGHARPLDDHALREARAMARLSHANVVTIHDVGTTDDGVFIAMERMEGGTLTEWLRSAPRSWSDVVAAFIGAGRGLAEAHRAGLVHRDFKSDNVLLGKDDVARVSDFGLALQLREPGSDVPGQSHRPSCSPGGYDARAGTLPYMAPEQLSGGRVDARSDQFSFCVSLFEALYGFRPFCTTGRAAPAAVLLAAIVEGRIARPPRGCKVPGRIAHAVHRGLACDPDQRWPSMGALVAELELRARPPLRRPRAVDAGIIVIAVFGLAWAALWHLAVTAADPGPDRQAASRILQRVLSRFHESGAPIRCEDSYPAEGDWAITLELDPGGGRINAHAGGTLAGEPVGACLLEELDFVIRSTSIPPDLDRSYVSHNVTLPVPR